MIRAFFVTGLQFFFCGRIWLKSFRQTPYVFLAVLKPGGSLVAMTNDDKQ